MLYSMSWSQFLGWVAYAEQEPFGEARADLRSAIVASLIANANRNSKKRPKPYTASDFMPEFGQAHAKRQARTPLTSAESWAQAKRIATSLARSPK